MTENQNCGSCEYWIVNPKDEKQGQCRGGPPQVIVLTGQAVKGGLNNRGILTRESPKMVQQVQVTFPTILANDIGCGLYSPSCGLSEGTEDTNDEKPSQMTLNTPKRGDNAETS